MTRRHRIPDRRVCRRWMAVTAVLLGATLGHGGPARADRSVTSAELIELANNGPRATEELAGITSVDGQPFDPAPLLEGSPEDVAQRLDALVKVLSPTPPLGRDTAVAPSPASKADPGEQARDILDDRRFRASWLPRPFAGALRWLGQQLGTIAAFFAPIFDNALTAAIFVATVAGAATLILVTLARRRQRVVLRTATNNHNPLKELNADQLERDAEAASRAGDLDRALRLRFLAGLVRLDSAGQFDYEPSATTDALRSKVSSAVFDGLAERHDEVAYGDRSATDQDLQDAIAGWSELSRRKR